MTENATPTPTEQEPEPQKIYFLKILVADDPNRPDTRFVSPVGPFPSEAVALQRFRELREQDSRIDGYQVLDRPVDEPTDDEETHSG